MSQPSSSFNNSIHVYFPQKCDISVSKRMYALSQLVTRSTRHIDNFLVWHACPRVSICLFVCLPSGSTFSLSVSTPVCLSGLAFCLPLCLYFLYLFICRLSVTCLSVCLSACPHAWLSSRFACQLHCCIFLSGCNDLPVCLLASFCLFVCLSACLLARLPYCLLLSVYLSTCLSVRLPA